MIKLHCDESQSKLTAQDPSLVLNQLAEVQVFQKRSSPSLSLVAADVNVVLIVKW